MKWEIYKNLKFLRQEKNLTVDELSKLSGVSKAKILSIERELSFEHNIEDIARLALVLDVTVDDFVCQKFYEDRGDFVELMISRNVRNYRESNSLSIKRNIRKK